MKAIIALTTLTYLAGCSSAPKAPHYTEAIFADGIITPAEYLSMNLWDTAKYEKVYLSCVNQIGVAQILNQPVPRCTTVTFK